MTQRRVRLLAAVGIALSLGAAVLCFGPWYRSHVTTLYMSSLKPLGLLAATLLAFVVVRSQGRDEPQRRSWVALAVGIALTTAAQGILAFFQLVLGVRVPFPSPADPLFVLGTVLIFAGFVGFAVRAQRSGLPLGSAPIFWAPAAFVLVAFGAGAPSMLGPVVQAGGSVAELGLNLFYPTASFVVLAPLAVLLRMALKFRGGRLVEVWLPLALGFAAVAVSDVLFAYFTTLNLAALEPLLDLLYFVGYMLIPSGIAFQAALLSPTSEPSSAR